MAAPVAPAAPKTFDEGHLLSLCSGLGGVRELPDGSTAYVRDDEALDCLVDIQRFLRRDDPARRAVVCQLAEWNTLRGHIVPLMCTYASDFDLLFNATKVRARGAAAAPSARPARSRRRAAACGDALVSGYGCARRVGAAALRCAACTATCLRRGFGGKAWRGAPTPRRAPAPARRWRSS